MNTTLQQTLDRDIFEKYAGLALPRHVSYPMPTWWEDCTPAEGLVLLRAAGRLPHPPDLSLYVHIPFCAQACRYCGCTRIAQPLDAPGAAELTERYVAALLHEIELLAPQLGSTRRVKQIHFGGGTPTYLSPKQLDRLFAALAVAFGRHPDAEVAIELDPRTVTPARLDQLCAAGVTRISLGVQDFDPEVQAHVGREQSFDMVAAVVADARTRGIRSINFDLIYGLPRQTLNSVAQTLAQTLTLRPDRVAFYQYAMIPDKMAEQRGLDYGRLPDSTAKLEMFLLGLERFEAAGYEFIGLDHFALPDEPLARARQKRTLQRNFQGMTTGRGLDLVGLGASSISQPAGGGFVQNVRKVDDYLARLEADELAIFRGKALSRDDRIRQRVLNDLYCYGAVEFAEIEAVHDVRFAEYFGRELAILTELAADGLVACNAERVAVTRPLGSVLMRTVGAVFDAYLAPDAYRVGDRQYFSANA